MSSVYDEIMAELGGDEKEEKPKTSSGSVFEEVEQELAEGNLAPLEGAKPLPAPNPQVGTAEDVMRYAEEHDSPTLAIAQADMLKERTPHPLSAAVAGLTSNLRKGVPEDLNVAPESHKKRLKDWEEASKAHQPLAFRLGKESPELAATASLATGAPAAATGIATATKYFPLIWTARTILKSPSKLKSAPAAVKQILTKVMGNADPEKWAAKRLDQLESKGMKNLTKKELDEVTDYYKSFDKASLEKAVKETDEIALSSAKAKMATEEAAKAAEETGARSLQAAMKAEDAARVKPPAKPKKVSNAPAKKEAKATLKEAEQRLSEAEKNLEKVWKKGGKEAHQEAMKQVDEAKKAVAEATKNLNTASKPRFRVGGTK